MPLIENSANSADDKIRNLKENTYNDSTAELSAINKIVNQNMYTEWDGGKHEWQDCKMWREVWTHKV